MKTSWLKVAIVLLSFLLFPAVSADYNAHKEVFLKGTYIEVGVNTNGVYGTAHDVPPGAGFHPIGGRSKLGFVADVGKDGWDTGSPAQSGDYFMPGSWEEGFLVEWDTEEQRNKFNAGSTTQIANITPLTETSSGTTKSVVWAGEVSEGDEKVRIVHTTSFDEDDAYFVVNTVLTNIGSVALNSFEFMRTVDPDNDKDLTNGQYSTQNYIAYFPYRDDGKALVVAKGYTYENVVLGLGTINYLANASPIASGIRARDPDYPLDTPRTACTSESPCVGDLATPLAFRLGTFYPGQSWSVDYAYILNENDLDAALGDVDAVTILQPTGTVSGTSTVFQATTNDVPGTDSIEFFVDGTSIGVDNTPDFGGNFHTTFDSTSYSDGSLGLKVIASFSNGDSVQKMSTVTVGNSGPPINFSAPTSDQNFEGTGISIGINVLDAEQPPTAVRFYRETTAGSTYLSEDTSAPFTGSFDVDDLSNGDTVIIKAVAVDASDKTTTASVSGRVYDGASFYNVPSGFAVADSTDDSSMSSGSTFSARKFARFEASGSGKKFAEVWFDFHEGDVDLVHLELDSADNTFQKASVIDWSSVESGENLNKSKHALFVGNEWNRGAFICPDALLAEQVNASCSSITSFSHAECAAETEKDSITCTVDESYYKLSGLEGTGAGANGNAELEISDSAEGSSADTDADINFFAEYTNATSGDHISGASCNVTFDDDLGTYFEMDEDADNDRYNYTKIGGFSGIGSHDWVVICGADNFNSVNATDTVSVIVPVPEFSDYAILLILITVAGGFFVIRNKNS